MRPKKGMQQRMSSSLEKVKSIFRSPGIAAVLRWSKCVHLKVVMICLITVVATVCSLCFTLATKGLVDGAWAFPRVRRSAWQSRGRF